MHPSEIDEATATVRSLVERHGPASVLTMVECAVWRRAHGTIDDARAEQWRNRAQHIRTLAKLIDD